MIVLGQSRSGTTLDFNLLAVDCSNLAARFRSIEVFVNWPPLIKVLLTRTRPLDNVPSTGTVSMVSYCFGMTMPYVQLDPSDGIGNICQPINERKIVAKHALGLSDLSCTSVGTLLPSPLACLLMFLTCFVLSFAI
jgi:hypothetical protein